MDKWNTWYAGVTKETLPTSFHYGDTVTYAKGFEWVKSCEVVEDWGCGVGGFKRFFTTNTPKYIGVDGSRTPFANVKADLTAYTSDVDGIFMRHVLEHNYEWKSILRNACGSFRKKLCIVLFTPLGEDTVELAHNAKHGVDVPDLSLNSRELVEILADYNCKYRVETVDTSTGYSGETILYIEKGQ